MSSPPDGLGGWPLKCRQPDRQALAHSAPRQGFAGARLRPPWTRLAAHWAKLINESQHMVFAYGMALMKSRVPFAIV